jgi:hypothetical protein
MATMQSIWAIAKIIAAISVTVATLSISYMVKNWKSYRLCSPTVPLIAAIANIYITTLKYKE